MQKYSNELKYITNYYKEQEKKRAFYKEKALRCMSKNIDVMKKIQHVLLYLHILAGKQEYSQ